MTMMKLNNTSTRLQVLRVVVEETVVLQDRHVGRRHVSVIFLFFFDLENFIF